MRRLFQDGMALWEENAKAAILRGMALVGERLMNDAIMDVPRVPIDMSSLRGSGSVFVGGKLIATSERVAAQAGGKPSPARSVNAQLRAIGLDVVEAIVGFNTPYAARLHEHPEFNFGVTREKRKKRRPVGTGGKFLSDKMGKNRDRYMKIIAAEVKAVRR